jgi:hypothetical protein
MENLALLAVQAQNVISSGNAVLNATQVSGIPDLLFTPAEFNQLERAAEVTVCRPASILCAV